MLNNNQPTSRICCSAFYNFKVITLSGAAREGGVEACILECRPWRRLNTLYSDI